VTVVYCYIGFFMSTFVLNLYSQIKKGFVFPNFVLDIRSKVIMKYNCGLVSIILKLIGASSIPSK
jgi:hypothetical protein